MALNPVQTTFMVYQLLTISPLLQFTASMAELLNDAPGDHLVQSPPQGNGGEIWRNIPGISTHSSHIWIYNERERDR